MQNKLKFSLGTLISAIVSATILIIYGIIALFDPFLIFELSNVYLGDFIELVEFMAIIIFFTNVTYAAFMIIGGLKSKTSKAWNIVLVVFGANDLLGSLTTIEISPIVGLIKLLVASSLLTFAILNLYDLKKQKTLANDNGQVKTPDETVLEKRLRELSDLRERNIISEEEYQNLRTSAINKNL